MRQIGEFLVFVGGLVLVIGMNVLTLAVVFAIALWLLRVVS